MSGRVTAHSAMILACAAVMVLQQPVIAASEKWQIDAKNSSVDFAVKNLGLGVKGKFTSVSGNVNYDEKHLSAATVEANIDASSINTGIGPRDHHLKTKDFFNVAKFTQLEFRSTKIVVNPSGDFNISGTLQMHGVTKEIVLHAKPLSKPTEDKDGKTHLVTTATAQLNRKDYSIGGFAAASISNNVDITLNINLMKN